MKTKSPSQILATAEQLQGLQKGSIEKKYQGLRRKVDSLPTTNIPKRRLRFIHRPREIKFDMNKLKFK